MEIIFTLWNIALFIFIYISILFGIAYYKKNNTLADIGWGIGFCIALLLLFLGSFNKYVISFIITLLILTWGIRLSLHIYFRSKDKEEDFRYVHYRNIWKKWFFLRSYVQLFLVQGFFMFVILLPVIFIFVFRNHQLYLIDGIAFLLWCIGFYFEATSDYQLYQFKKNNTNKLYTEKLWSLTRHPNYFGECTMWWSIWLFSIPTSFWFITILSPLLLTYLIFKVSGIPLLEKKYASYKEFALYKKNTPLFFPKIK